MTTSSLRAWLQENQTTVDSKASSASSWNSSDPSLDGDESDTHDDDEENSEDDDDDESSCGSHSISREASTQNTQKRVSFKTNLPEDGYMKSKCFDMIFSAHPFDEEPEVRLSFVKKGPNNDIEDLNNLFDIWQTNEQILKNKAIDDSAKEKVRTKKKRRSFIEDAKKAYLACEIDAEYDILIEDLNERDYKRRLMQFDEELYIYVIVHVDGERITEPPLGYVNIHGAYQVGEEFGLKLRFKTTNWQNDGISGSVSEKVGSISIEVGFVTYECRTRCKKVCQNGNDADVIEQAAVQEEPKISKFQTEFTKVASRSKSNDNELTGSGWYHELSRSTWRRLALIPKAKVEFFYATEEVIAKIAKNERGVVHHSDVEVVQVVPPQKEKTANNGGISLQEQHEHPMNSSENKLVTFDMMESNEDNDSGSDQDHKGDRISNDGGGEQKDDDRIKEGGISLQEQQECPVNSSKNELFRVSRVPRRVAVHESDEENEDDSDQDSKGDRISNDDGVEQKEDDDGSVRGAVDHKDDNSAKEGGLSLQEQQEYHVNSLKSKLTGVARMPEELSSTQHKHFCHDLEPQDDAKLEADNGKRTKKAKLISNNPQMVAPSNFVPWLLANGVKPSAIDVLVDEEIEDINTLIQCTERQLVRIGIKLGSIVKLLGLIEEYKKKVTPASV